MAMDMQRLIGVSDEDDEEDMEMDVKEGGNDGRNSASSVLAAMDGSNATDSNNKNSQFRHHPQVQEHPSTPGGTRRPRPLEEKERTKLRERHRRAITARILAGLRRHGNYNLRVRADINDVIAALAREAGWVVLPDGTTFPSKSHSTITKPSTVASTPPAASSSDAMPQQTPHSPSRAISSGYQHETEYDACQLKGVFDATSFLYDVPPMTQSHSSSLLGDRVDEVDCDLLVAGSVDNTVNKQMVQPSLKLQERDFAGSPYVPVYVMLPLGVINIKCELTDPDGLFNQLRMLKSINVDGVRVDCWWGIVEAQSPQMYNWNGYRRLFQIVRELRLKLQVVMSFHECGGNFSDDVCIPLPHWVTEIGRSNPSIYFTDKEGRRNPECLSWGIDKERVLQGRTAVEVYFDYMRNFRMEFNEFFKDGIVSMIEIGLGPCGELRYPSFPVKHGWRYPGIGAFQCYDQYLLKSLRKAAEARGHPFWGRAPDNAGSYGCQPHETGFFCNGGDYDGYYGRFFLHWYSQVLIEHGDRVLHLAKLAFEGTCISAKLSGIHWWYKTSSHAAELTAGYYNSCNRDGYAAILFMLKKHEIALNFACAEVGILCQQEDFHDSVADRDGLMWQVSTAAWDASILISSENRLSCHSREGYNELLHRAKPLNDPDGRHLLSFAYHRYSPLLTERHNFIEFQQFVKRMHGDTVLDHQV